MEKVILEWEKLENYQDVKNLDDEEEDCGIYQVYCDHVVFGPHSLVYIGEITDRTFKKRFKEHEEWLEEENDIEIRVGRLKEGTYPEDDGSGKWKGWKDLVERCEALLIYWHTPPYNARNLNRYKKKPLHIKNWGNRGSLLPECSSDWEPERPEDKEE